MQPTPIHPNMNPSFSLMKSGDHVPSGYVFQRTLSGLLIFITAFAMTTAAQNVVIIESQSYNYGHMMDNVWLGVATGMGMNASILGQSTLYDTTFFSGTDVLIVSSGVIILSNTQITTITQFIQSGKSIYLQGEYDCPAYNTNGTFESLVNTYGGSFSLNGTISGTLAPMEVLGTLATTPNTVTPLSYFWYGCRGNSCSYVEPFLQYNGDYFGFIFCPPISDYGRVVFTTDQDWVNQSTSLPLMENILSLITSNSYQCSGLNYLNADLGADTTICEDSTYVLNGGGPGFSYQWSTGSTDTSITVSSAGVYWVSKSNGLCTTSDTVVISEISCNGSPVWFAGSDTALCEKFCIDFADSSSNNPIAWQWIFPGASPSSSTAQNPTNICYDVPGTYDVTLIVTITNGSDTLTMPDYITVHPTPPLPTIIQAGYTLTSSPASSYQWQLNLVNIPGATNQSYTVLQSGYYTVIVSDSNGCKNSFTQYVLISGIGDVMSDADISIYPNPSSGNFTIELSNEMNADEVSIEIINTLGQKIFSSDESGPTGAPEWLAGLNSKKREIDLHNAANGIYFIRVKTQNNFLQEKIMITN